MRILAIILCLFTAEASFAQDTLDCKSDLIDTSSVFLSKKTQKPYTGKARCIDGKTVSFGFLKAGVWSDSTYQYERVKSSKRIPEMEKQSYIKLDGQVYRKSAEGYFNNGEASYEKYFYYYKSGLLKDELITIGDGFQFSYSKNGKKESKVKVVDGKPVGDYIFFD